MITFIHCADIHLKTEEKAYGFSVLSEIIALANDNKAQFLLICGDLFDTFKDAESLHRDVARLFSTCLAKILFIPGNHDTLRKTGDLSAFDFAPARLCHTLPYEIITEVSKDQSIEFIAIPHQTDYSAWRDWAIPAKQSNFRVALFHGLVENMVYTGPNDTDNEEGAACISSSFFSKHSITYAALGHIHAQRSIVTDNTICAYPGSATVWRKGETGNRTVIIARSNNNSFSTTLMLLNSAGTFLQYPVPLSPGTEVPDISALATTWTNASHVELVLSGIIENEELLKKHVDHLCNLYSGAVRHFDISTDNVGILPGISSLSLTKHFIDQWNKAKLANTTDDPAVIFRARELALFAIKKAMEARA
jgi:DNA repair exonuclease SbcCD nuclease subunit